MKTKAPSHTKLLLISLIVDMTTALIITPEGSGCDSAVNCNPGEGCRGSCITNSHNTGQLCVGQCISTSTSCQDTYDKCEQWLHLCSNSVVAKVCTRSCNRCQVEGDECREDGFKCDGRCQPLLLFCDGIVDCTDKGDEEGCTYYEDLWFSPGLDSRRCGVRPYDMPSVKVEVRYVKTKRSLGLVKRSTRRRMKRLVGAKHARPFSWPWTGYLANYGDMSMCGATLIHPQWALTAAHCLLTGQLTSPPNTTPPDSIFITFGRHSSSNSRYTEIPTRQIRNASETIFFKAYENSDIYDDIALVKLREPVVLNEFVNVACMPLVQDVRQFHKVGGVATGWGHDEFSKTPRSLKQVVMKPLRSDRCAEKLFHFNTSSPWYGVPIQLKSSLLCTELDPTSQYYGGLCSGDSGGPMVGRRGTGSYALVGVATFSSHENCSEIGSASVYNSVYYYLPWIKQHVQHLEYV